jgi:hypothetical protein
MFVTSLEEFMPLKFLVKLVQILKGLSLIPPKCVRNKVSVSAANSFLPSEPICR